MEKEQLVHESTLEIAGASYGIQVFARNDGRHIAKTVFDRDDIFINDGLSLEDVLGRHRVLLPLAIDSRAIFRKKNTPNSSC